MKHVFGNKNKLLINYRRKSHGLYKRIKNFKGSNKSKLSDERVIICFPAFKNEFEKTDILNRFAWAFPESTGVKIKYAFNHKGSQTEKDAIDELEKNQKLFLNESANIIQVSDAELKNSFDSSDVIAVHKKGYKYHPSLYNYLVKCEIIDPSYYSLEESNFWKFGLYNLLSEVDKLKYNEISERNFTRFIAKNGKKNRANIFVTGPSFGSYKQFDFKNDQSINIVCNTIVKDTEFLEYIGGPHFITFADPVFHFSSNLYSVEFRRLVVEAVKKYDSFVIVPHATLPLMLENYPELSDNIIGLKRSDDITYPTRNNLRVKPASSIITFIMLPLGLSLAENIFVIGADGRGKNEKYFWKHNDKVQLTDLMETVFNTHPSFFRDRDYADYYDEHCMYIENLLSKAENELGKKIYSLTESFIPAFKKRLFQES